MVIAFDPSYIPKADKSTYDRGRYWSGAAGAAKWGLNIGSKSHPNRRARVE